MTIFFILSSSSVCFVCYVLLCLFVMWFDLLDFASTKKNITSTVLAFCLKLCIIFALLYCNLLACFLPQYCKRVLFKKGIWKLSSK